MKISLGGITWIGILCILLAAGEASERVVVSSGRGGQVPKQPQVAIGSDDRVHVVFGLGDSVQYAQSADKGATFDKATAAFQIPNMSLGMRRGPRIVATGNSLVVTAVGGKHGKGKDGDVLSWRSSDGGKSWAGPVRVNDVADSAREGLHAMASSDDGQIWCVWLDLRNKSTEIFASRSVDGGASWEPNILVYRSPDGSVCQCCHPSVIVVGKRLVIMFRNLIDGNRDMYVTSSEDSGKSFSPAVKLGHGTWHLDACPMDGGMLAAGADGLIETAWRRDDKIYAVAGPDKAEVMVGRGQQPWIAATKSEAFIVWTTGREGDLILHASRSHGARKIATGARDPMIVASSQKPSPVFCCWEEKHGEVVEIVMQRIDTLE